MLIDVRTLAHILTTTRYQFLGVTAYPFDPSVDPPCCLLEEFSMNCFQNAAISAAEHWPSNLAFALIGGYVLAGVPAGIMVADCPREYQRIQAPKLLLQYRNTSP